MRNWHEKNILEILVEEEIESMMNHIKAICDEAKKNILKIEEENPKSYN